MIERLIERFLGGFLAFIMVVCLFISLIGLGIGLFVTSLVFLGIGGVWALVDSRKGFIIPLFFVLGIFVLIIYTIDYKENEGEKNGVLSIQV